LFQLLTAVFYWALLLLWVLVFVLYMANFRHFAQARKQIAFVLFILAVNSFYVFADSSFYQDYVEVIRGSLLVQENIEYYKLVNIGASVALLMVLIFWWIPREVKDKEAWENKLEESEERFRTITENTTDITVILDDAHNFSYISPSVEKVIDYKADDLINKSSNLFIHPEDYPEVQEIFNKAMETGGVTHVIPDFRLRHRDAHWIDFEGLVTYMPDIRGVEGLVMNCRDIRKRKEAYELLTHRLDMDALVSNISTEFINLGSSDLSDKIEHTLEALGLFAHVDHAYLYQVEGEEGALVKRFEWKAEGVTKALENAEVLLPDDYPYVAAKIRNLEPVYIPNVEALGGEAKNIKRLLTEDGVKSLLMVPVSRNGAPVGFLGLDTIGREKHWSDHDIGLLTVIGEIISNAIERNKAEEQLRTLSQAMEQSTDSVMIIDLDGNIEYVNSRFQKTTGYSCDEVIGKKSSFILSEPSETLKEEVWADLLDGKNWFGELCSTKKDGTIFWEYVTFSPIKSPDGHLKHFLSVREDITLRKEYEAKLVYQANYDELTGLPNRVLLQDRLAEAITRAETQKRKIALMLFGLDAFKKVNETMGHSVGDKLLKEAGMRLKGEVKSIDTVARLGGDEFLIILPDLDTEDYAESVAVRILKAFSMPFLIDDHEITMNASLGIAVYPNDGDTPDTLLRDAGAAMHRAKEKGNNFQFFTEEMHSHALARVKMEAHLRRALHLEELSLNYQPIVDVKGTKLAGAEALIRWTNEELGFVSPVDFIPLAEDIGMIVPIGKWVLTTACEQAKVWQDIKGAPDYVTVNVSVRQFGNNHFSQTVAEVLHEVGLPPSCLMIEVTESLLMSNIGEIESQLREIKDMGVRISMDDFGTGYSSLSYLKRFDFDILKVDRAFVNDIPEDKGDCALVEAIIAMAHGLGLEVVAEGVETKEQSAYLKKLRCDKIQGYFYSKPLASADFDELIVNWKKKK